MKILGICRSCLSLVMFRPHLRNRMGTVGVEKVKNIIMGGLQCLARAAAASSKKWKKREINEIVYYASSKE